jgi:membrane protein YdbS with pleckstrin-like domain
MYTISSSYSDQRLWVVKPSQLINFFWILLGIFLIQTGVFPLLAIVKVLDVYFWRYEFGERTLIERRGILSVTRTEFHYYRIKSIKVEEPLWMRVFDLANVRVMTSDPYQKEVLLYAVPKGVALREALRKLTHNRRKEEGIREFDLYEL